MRSKNLSSTNLLTCWWINTSTTRKRIPAWFAWVCSDILPNAQTVQPNFAGSVRVTGVSGSIVVPIAALKAIGPSSQCPIQRSLDLGVLIQINAPSWPLFKQFKLILGRTAAKYYVGIKWKLKDVRWGIYWIYTQDRQENQKVKTNLVETAEGKVFTCVRSVLLAKNTIV